jgi:RES domain-containing protein
LGYISQSVILEPYKKIGGKGTAADAVLLFPSLHHAGGTNLVIFHANLTGADIIQVHDPDGALPRDQSSWAMDS